MLNAFRYFETVPSLPASRLTTSTSSRHRTVQTIIRLLENQLLHSTPMQSMREKQLDLSYILLNRTTRTTVSTGISTGNSSISKNTNKNTHNDIHNERVNKNASNDEENDNENEGDGSGMGNDGSVLPTFLLDECLHYLRAYGSPSQLVRFYARHGMFKIEKLKCSKMCALYLL